MSMSGNTSSDILIAGAFAAFSVDLLVYPLDTLKTRFQSPNYYRYYVNPTTQAPKPALFRGLYQGLFSVIIATLPSSGAFFTTYEQTKSLLTYLNPPSAHSSSNAGLIPAPIIHSTASSIAELVSCAILTPAEVIKQNAQMVKAGSPTNATLQTLKKFRSNPTALWRGYTALAGRNLPFTALQFPMFEKMKLAIKEYRAREGLATGTILESGIITAVSAGSAGAVAAVVTTPIDVVKTRIMLSAADDAAHEAAKSLSQPKSNGLVDAFGKSVEKGKGTLKAAAENLNPVASGQKKSSSSSAWRIGKEIMREKGFKGLWRGGALRAVWTFVGSGLYLGVYESGRVYLANRRGEHVDEEDLL
ncbi:mitochondrial carrier protein-like protein [Aaosphaeria arxii CBS 175.79]|uniref:Mitochondrial carrier protein-like protein n=1 Tax=Aaosphaeria arxii CBS 175.79 TaxID=1450172 RepID=A0A6A5Y0F1_9PLEO|nr:mitochondrial carrier protein-like protein [Aaosphaeria arxii CBS 175.79]KAF2018706.1 mitochondrial carrier protein-like protein [Aaosphaeria arxii CBS 175.79]